MKTKIFITLIFTMIIAGCSEDNPLSTGSNPDAVINSRIIGNWKYSSTYSITYKADSTFIDSSFYQNQYDSTKFSVNMISVGRYSITNAVIKKTNVHIVYIDSIHNKGLGEIVWAFDLEVEIINSRIIMTPVRIFDRVQGSGDQLWGTWTKTTCIYICGSNPSQVVYEGRQKETYLFNKDSVKFSYGWEYLDGNPFPNPTFSSDYLYEPPKLSLYGPAEYIKKVEFKNGRMYWYFYFPSIEFGIKCGNKTIPPNETVEKAGNWSINNWKRGKSFLKIW